MAATAIAEPTSAPSTLRPRSLTNFLRQDSQLSTDHKTPLEDDHETYYREGDGEPLSPGPEMAADGNQPPQQQQQPLTTKPLIQITTKITTKNPTTTVLDAETRFNAQDTPMIAGPRPRARSGHEGEEDMGLIMAKILCVIMIIALLLDWFMGFFQHHPGFERALGQYHVMRVIHRGE